MTSAEDPKSTDAPLEECPCPRWQKLPWFVFITLGIAALLLVYLFWPRTNAYSVSANTEIIRFTVTDPDGATSSLIEQAEVVDWPQGQSIAGARLHIEPGTTVNATRHRGGSLELGFEVAGDVPVARVLLSDGPEIALNAEAGIRVPFDEPGRVFILAFDGSVTIGNEPGPRVDTVLLDGTIAILEEQPIFHDRFLLDRSDVEVGAVVDFRKRRGTQDQPAEAKVLLHVDSSAHSGEASAIHVTASSSADEVVVRRYGVADYSIRPSPWARIRSDPLSQWLLTSLAILAALTALVDFVERHFLRRHKDEQILEPVRE